ncbi:nuclear transport factor 2 family protein [Sphingomonas sp. AAP5]|uniref:nuclear transport factor 2 family protein n=1 Tax=Sphingomonas sp. AAP5 TaxID=1523415 RepID=UPI001057467B|nr:nuclear transport factor 2 family protein [Sphingomonas sp. AAP5]QBM75143.1 nuclear transport factor 2 family protein [Sphingomonas sp. AAP5]
MTHTSEQTADWDEDQRSANTEQDRSEIRDLLQNWIIWRDAGDWDRFATVWHDDGRMVATWFRANAADFIAGCRKAFDAGMIGLHSLGGTSIDLQGDRAVAQSKMQIVQRGDLDGVEVDVTCLGRFVDAFEKRNGRWGLVLRQPVYELDRMTPVSPAAVISLDEKLLRSFPIGYRHLAYLQTILGFTVDKGLPGTRGPAIEALTKRMKQWLDGADATCLDS